MSKTTQPVVETPTAQPALAPSAQVWKQRFEQEYARVNEITLLWEQAESRNRELVALLQRQHDALKAAKPAKAKPTPKKTVN